MTNWGETTCQSDWFPPVFWYCADQLISVIHEVRFIAFFFCGMLLGHELFNIFYFFKKMCLYKNKLPILFALWRLFYVLLSVSYKFLEPNRHFMLKMGSDINDGFVGLN